MEVSRPELAIDGGPPAAMRYTEARMTHYAVEMLTDLEKETVPFGFNFDGTLREVVGLKLGMSMSQILASAKPSAKVNLVPEFRDGRTAYQEMCTMCHNTNRIDKAMKSPECWKQTVAKRLHMGAIDDPKLVDMITDYLVNRSTGGQRAAAN
jgi:hypothetical protein